MPSGGRVMPDQDRARLARRKKRSVDSQGEFTRQGGRCPGHPEQIRFADGGDFLGYQHDE